MSSSVRFSFILPVSHGGAFLQDALDSIAAVCHPPETMEVIVAGHDRDLASQSIVSKEVNRRYPVRGVWVSKSTRGHALNAAVAVARNEVLVFIDDDCALPPDYLEKLTDEIAAAPDFGVIGGKDILVRPRSDFDVALDYVLNSPLGGRLGRRRTDAFVDTWHPKLWNMAVRRQVAAEVSSADGTAFSALLPVHEDVEFVQRVRGAGHPVVFAPDLVVWHRRDTSLRSMMRRNYLMGQVSRVLGMHRSIHRTAVAICSMTLGLAFTGFWLSWARFAFALAAGAYVLALAAMGLHSVFRFQRPGLLGWVPLCFVGLHGSRVAGYVLPIWGLGRTSLT